MIKIYKEGKEVSTDDLSFCWIDVSNPSAEEQEYVVNKWQLPRDFITDPLDPDERSRIEIYGEYTFFIIRIPIKNKSSTPPFITLPIGIILKNNMIITICAYEKIVYDYFISNISSNNLSYPDLILLIFQRISLKYLYFLRNIQRMIGEAENKLRSSMRNEELITLLNLEKSLLYFTTSLRSNELMLERLTKTKFWNLLSGNEDLFNDVLIDNKQALEMANIYNNILSGMMDAFASIISNNLNIVMKFLTSVTIILMIPTLVASFYGMNVSLPFQNSPHAFLITIIISAVFSAIATWIFYHQKWF